MSPRRITASPEQPSGISTAQSVPPGGRTGRSGSATQALLDVLEEYVAPDGEGVWQETLVGALRVLGHGPAAVRQAVSRSAREGALTSSRHGNRSYVELTEEARETLLLGAEHLRGEAGRDDWDGTWDVFVVQSKGRNPSAHYRLRTSMLLNGLGYLGNGVWISPRARFKDEIVEALSAEPGVSVTRMVSRIEHPEARIVAERAWDLDAVADRYERLLADFGDRAPEGPEDCFRDWTELVHAWRACVLAEPGLPSDVLGLDWPYARARDLVEDRRHSWGPQAHAYFRSLTPEGTGAREAQ
ncbi:PaaX family transcriptional regulator C-terminal domain-containing protein [Streptomyces sp. NRRL S-646]|uniref:PaaX family transcriptional regulator n=1 Tax=Streptomyces sp. NRRL S-646 TaxID=1463917 RepID=UPI0004CAD6EE|nr:PaaX family transcriptional regulator C-terminal domain-containing protein [Streptomyces sp. NRRL S-646]